MNAMETALETAVNERNEQTVTQGTAYFDLMSYTSRTKIAEVASQMAQAIAFTVDVQLTSALRSLLRSLRTQHESYDIDTIGDMQTKLEEIEFAEKVMRDCGHDHTGTITTIHQFTMIRESWHQLAKELTAMTFDWQGVPRTYNYDPIEEMLVREVKLSVKPMTARRIRLQVERHAGDAPKEDIERAVARREQMEEERARDKSKALMEQQDALLTLWNVIDDWKGEYVSETSDFQANWKTADELQFHDLAAPVRRVMIEAALRGAQRAEDFATSSSSITDTEFDAIGFEVMRVQRELGAVLKGIPQ